MDPMLKLLREFINQTGFAVCSFKLYFSFPIFLLFESDFLPYNIIHRTLSSYCTTVWVQLIFSIYMPHFNHIRPTFSIT